MEVTFNQALKRAKVLKDYCRREICPLCNFNTKENKCLLGEYPRYYQLDQIYNVREGEE